MHVSFLLIFQVAYANIGHMNTKNVVMLLIAMILIGGGIYMYRQNSNCCDKDSSHMEVKETVTTTNGDGEVVEQKTVETSNKTEVAIEPSSIPQKKVTKKLRKVTKSVSV